MSGTVHAIENDEDVAFSFNVEDNNELCTEMERALCTTAVVNIYSDPNQVLQLLCSAFRLMVMSRRTHHRGNLSR